MDYVWISTTLELAFFIGFESLVRIMDNNTKYVLKRFESW